MGLRLGWCWDLMVDDGVLSPRSFMTSSNSFGSVKVVFKFLFFLLLLYVRFSLFY